MNAETRRRIRLFIRQYRGSQGELAQMLGISQTFLCAWLNGRAVSKRLESEIPKHMENLRERMLERGTVARDEHEENNVATSNVRS